MTRSAFLSSATLGALEAYDQVITDLSKILEVEDTAIKTLFFGGMILSGIDEVIVPKSIESNLPHQLADYASYQDQALFDEISSEVNEFFWSNSLIGPDHTNASHIHELSTFFAEILAAADYNKPLLTTFPVPTRTKHAIFLKREVHDLISFLEESVLSTETNSPLLTLEISKKEVGRVKILLGSSVFKDYSASVKSVQLEHLSQSSVRLVGERAMNLVHEFDDILGIRKVSSKVFGLVPEFIELLFGKLSGKASRVITDPISKIIEGRQSIQIHSFHPIWREVWEKRLNNVREIIEHKKALENHIEAIKLRANSLKRRKDSIENELKRKLDTKEHKES